MTFLTHILRLKAIFLIPRHFSHHQCLDLQEGFMNHT